MKKLLKIFIFSCLIATITSLKSINFYRKNPHATKNKGAMSQSDMANCRRAFNFVSGCVAARMLSDEKYSKTDIGELVGITALATAIIPSKKLSYTENALWVALPFVAVTLLMADETETK